MENPTKKLLSWYLTLNIADALITNWVLRVGGSELNPVFHYLLSKGFNVYEIKLMVLIPLWNVWKTIYDQDTAIAIKLLRTGVFLMIGLVVVEVLGIIYIYV
jgi:hypothetical protein